METYKIIKKFLAEGGKCILIENDKPIGVVLNVEEYELLQGGAKGEVVAVNPIGEAMAKEIDSPEVSAEISDIEAADDVTLGDLGIDELPY